tara:strand:- start:23 stop:868 length:846 start_codon:yes stop_codon:yes gene_type:complete
MEDDWKKYIISGIFSAGITKTGIAPFVRVKTLMQIQSYHNTNNYKNLWGSLKYIMKNEGFIGLYKGNMINIAKAVPNYCMKFTFNEYYIKYLLRKNGVNKIGGLKFYNLLEAGIVTGAVQTTMVYPIDLVRTRIIQDRNMLGKDFSIRQCVKDIYTKRGLLSFYSGFLPAILSAPLYVGISLANYQYLRSQDNILSNSFIAGGIAGVTSQTLTYPGDTIKKQLQINGMKEQKYTGLVDCVKSIYKQNKLKGFYRGFWINTLKAGPEIGLKFLVYEIVKTQL